MLRVEFHCHTIYSKDSLTNPESIIDTCYQKKIDRIVITDHNTIAGALKTQELDPERVIVGEEIMTLDGEILAAYVHEEIPPGLPSMEVITRLRDQGAFISISHPFDKLRDGHWESYSLHQIVPYIDAIEIFNARNMWPGGNRQAKVFAQKHGLPGTVGSDAHTPNEIGKAIMLLPDFEESSSLQSAILSTRYETKPSGIWIHLTSRYAVWKKAQVQHRNK